VVDAGPTGVTEPLALGRFAIAQGVRPKALDPLKERGIGHQVRYLDLPDADFVPSGSLLLFDRAPNLEAAQLFANWVLTREGQAVLADGLETNSARLDLAPIKPEDVGESTREYYEPDRETSFAHTAATRSRIRDLLASRTLP
jgi:hypothetical protein